MAKLNQSLFKTCLLGLILSTSAQAKQFQILHTNDTHAYLDGTTHDRSKGGAARLKSLMDFYKDKMKTEGVETISLDAGDFSEGNIYYMADRARKSFEVNYLMDYTAGVIGNHDYLMGPKDLDQLLGEMDSKYFLLGTNLEIPNHYKNLKERLLPYKELEIDGLKIGILGATAADIFFSWRFEDVKISSPKKSLLKYEEILKKRGNDFIFTTSHIGTYNDKRVAKASKYIDFMVSGHSHDTFTEPVMVKNKLKRDVPIVQTGQHTKYLGRAIVDLVKGKPLKLISYELIPVKYEAQDETLKRVVAEADNDLDDLYGKEWLYEDVGYSDLKLGDKKGPKKWAYFITDVLREKSGADIAIHTPPMNGDEYPIGAINRRDIINSMPRVFDIDDKNGWHIYTTQIRGAWLKFVFEALSLFGQPLTFSGINIEYDKSPLGFKVRKLMVNGKKLNPLKLYKVAFTEGIVRGAQGVSPYTLTLLRNPKKTDFRIWKSLEDKLKTDVHSIKNINETDKFMYDPKEFLPKE